MKNSNSLYDLAAFGLKRKKERKSQRDERKRAKSAKAPRKEQEEGDTFFLESMEKLQEQGDKISGVLESMEKNQAQQLQLMNQFIRFFHRSHNTCCLPPKIFT